MSRIIKQGKRKEKKVTCRECDSTIGYFKEEVQEYSGTDISGGPDGQTWIVCPSCGEKIILSSW
jgi:hypothetical protein